MLPELELADWRRDGLPLESFQLLFHKVEFFITFLCLNLIYNLSNPFYCRILPSYLYFYDKTLLFSFLLGYIIIVSLLLLGSELCLLSIITVQNYGLLHY